MVMVKGHIAVIGATGVTGGFAFDAAEKLGLHPIAFGRNQHRLMKFVATRGMSADRVKLYDPTDQKRFREDLAAVDAVISAVAPFQPNGMGIARAAAELGLGYTDPSGESGFISEVIATLDSVARGSGATLCTGNGTAAFIGDVAIQSIVDIDTDRVGAVLYDIQHYVPTAGSLKSYLSSILPSGGARVRDGEIELRPFADHAGLVGDLRGYHTVVPDALVVTRYWKPDRFEALGLAPGMPRWLIRALSGAVTGTLLGRLILAMPIEKWMPYRSGSADRSTVTVHAQVGPGDGAYRRRALKGHSIYPLTGLILAATIKAMLERGERPTGVRAASEMFVSTAQAMTAAGLETIY